MAASALDARAVTATASPPPLPPPAPSAAPRELFGEEAVPLAFGVGLTLLVVGNAVGFAGFTSGGLIVLLGTIGILTGASIHVFKDVKALARPEHGHVGGPRGGGDHVAVAVGDGPSSSASHEEHPVGENAIHVALDFPASIIQFVMGCFFVAGASLLLADVGLAGSVCVLIAALSSLTATGLFLGAEIERTRVVAVLAADALRLELEHLRASGRGATSDIDEATVRTIVCNVVAAHEAALGGPDRLPLGCAIFCCRERGSPIAHHPGPSAVAFRAAVSPLVMGAAALNFAASICLVVAASLLISSTVRGPSFAVSVATLVAFETAFTFFVAGIVALLCVGLQRVVSHRRAGRAHLEHDVRRSLSHARHLVRELAKE